MRKKRNHERHYKPDMKHGNLALGRFINVLMHDGKKSVAEQLIYDAFAIINEQTKEEPVEVFQKAIDNAMPAVEVASKRVGGANYQVPREVRPERKFMLATRWIIGAARAKSGSPMSKRLADELIAAANNDGAAIKKKQDVHRMAEANRAFAHFSW
ncbi:MAG: 30S ribosomal protein S7 [Candidatus Harrisonbacteria bacterium CG10_big_fil_rev_8_21_14_0_10_49_15]|uniref:Small ribosomal subunit protein uS7 n=1 Tax=Candidatus Harrisonbacteria bacterium CG10_big_fil_rev_8_21_14_0_10_49_15 TaxID=1974587 RepID=A0A2H0UKX8_9BACT|nr:MAG: 30S ribosomal protein S7 [Candidatus Harrisonbacteria bacterium CG10_big_fil_rev_8_21_14_0_10_49_15]